MHAPLKSIAYLGLALALVGNAYLQAEITPEVVLEGLKCPSGVAVQPETGDVYVAETAASRVIRVADKKPVEVITGFPVDEYGKGPIYQIGPLGLAFIDKNRLVIGDGSLPDGQEVMRIFDLSTTEKLPLGIDAAEHTSNPLAPEGEVPGEGNFYGVAVDAEAIYLTANGDDKKGWLAKAAVEKGGIGKLERFIATKENVDIDAPAAITISPRREIVVGQMGEISDATDSLLTFYSQSDKSLMLSLETDLRDIVGLAYSPKTGRLYAVDYSWADPSQGGLYRLDSVYRGGKQVVSAEKLLDLDQPTSLAFAPSGELYICVFGNGNGEDKSKAPATGKLLKIGEGL